MFNEIRKFNVSEHDAQRAVRCLLLTVSMINEKDFYIRLYRINPTGRGLNFEEF
tara:strand:- start:706 stop:867 length:162 start_codon:yes stop_codon:yes gene_type:complete